MSDSNQEISSNELEDTSYSVFMSKSADDDAMNGDLKHGGHSFLPNNNFCENVVTSVCATNDSCANSDISRTNDGELSSISSVATLDSSRENPEFSSTNDTNSSMNDITGSATPSGATATESDHSISDTDYGPEPPKRHNFKNGAIEKTNHRISKNRKKQSSGPGRGRPRKALVPMYQSQISGDKNTIKIRIKKSNITAQEQVTPSKKKSGRRRKHKVKSDTDASDYETSRKRNKLSAVKEDDVSSTVDPPEQTHWGNKIPDEILFTIFQYCIAQEGALPTLVRFGKVCKLWQRVALLPNLWIKVDLNAVKEQARTELRLHWLIQNRLTCCQDLNLGEWKIRNIQSALEALSESCRDLRGLNISGLQGLNADNLKHITTECKRLERLDLSYINSTSAINAQLFVSLGQTMNNRLTHLVLAHNKMSSFTQIVASIATHCPNLQLLDISNIKTFAHNTALLHVEKLQVGCPKLRVLRITNSQIWLAPASITEQVASPGFPCLEELSLAGLEEDKTTTSRSADNDVIDRILKCSTKLRLLDIRGCIRLTNSGLVRVPAWDLEHLFLSGCYITRAPDSGLELIVQKWSHSLLEVDLAWSTAAEPLDAAVTALAEKGSESRLRIINLCGSSVSLEPVKAVLKNCPNLHSINLQSCRALPRGIKRLYTGGAVAELRQSLEDKPKTDGADRDNEPSPVHSLSSASSQQE